MLTIFRNFGVALATAAALVIAGCGGGGTTAGTGGGVASAGGASSTLVIDLNGGGFAATDQQNTRAKTIADAFASLLARDAWAQLDAGTQIFINGALATNVTIIGGDAYIPLAPGDYVVCINADNTDPTYQVLDPNCRMVTVGPDQIVIVSGDPDPDNAGSYLLTDVQVDDAANNVVLYQDPDFANKTLVCHKGKMTLSVGTPAALNGHTVHGDSLGACPDVAGGNDGLNADQQSSNKGNKGNKGNNGNQGQGQSNRPS